MTTRKELVESVNTEINQNTTYKTDFDQFLKTEWWTVANGSGDCEDYALAKYRKLIELGIPATDIRLATCWVEDDLGYHAVLLVDDKEQNTTWVLDNRFEEVKSHLKAIDDGYRFHKIQIAGTKDWEDYDYEVTPISVFK